MAVAGSRYPSISNPREEIIFLHCRTQVIGLSSVERKQSSALRGSHKGPMKIRLKKVSSLSIKKMSSQQKKLVRRCLSEGPAGAQLQVQQKPVLGGSCGPAGE
jgi:hypothetical protein